MSSLLERLRKALYTLVGVAYNWAVIRIRYGQNKLSRLSDSMCSHRHN